MTNPSDAIIERIQKLLSLANSDNENEAKVATTKANELLIKYNLSLQEVKDSQFDYIESEVARTGLTIRPHQMMIANLLNKHFFVRVIVSKKYVGESSGQWAYKQAPRSQYSKSIKLVGTKENCQIAAYVFTYLNTVYPVLWKQYQLKNLVPATMKTSYFTGLTAGIDHILQQTKWRVQDETGLTVIEDPKLKEHVKKIANGTYGSSNQPDLDPTVFNHGKSDGKKVQLRKPIESDVKSSGLMIPTKKK